MKPGSFGNAAPKSRPFDVGANLLGEWIEGQARLRREILRYMVVLGASVAVAAVTVPALFRAAGEEAVKAKALRADVARLDEALVVSGRARKEAQPVLLVKEMCDRTQVSYSGFLGTMNRVLTAVNARTVLSSMRCEVAGGQAHVLLQALAEDNSAADAFARTVADEGSKIDAITNSRPSPVLGPQGISFEYVKRAPVAK